MRENRSTEYGSVNKWGGGCGLHLNKTSSYLLKTNYQLFMYTGRPHNVCHKVQLGCIFGFTKSRPPLSRSHPQTKEGSFGWGWAK